MAEFVRTGTPFSVLLLGLITGIAFGFVIFKIGASRYDKILKMLLLKDFEVLKFMMVAVAVGSIGVFLTDSVIYIAPMQWMRLIVGSLIFGVGFALLGGCPGTVMVSLGEGKKDALYGILGGLLGAALYAHVYPVMDKLFIAPYNLGKMTLYSALGVSYGVGLIIWVAVFAGGAFLIHKLFVPGGKKESAGVNTQPAKDV